MPFMFVYITCHIIFWITVRWNVKEDWLEYYKNIQIICFTDGMTILNEWINNFVFFYSFYSSLYLIRYNILLADFFLTPSSQFFRVDFILWYFFTYCASYHHYTFVCLFFYSVSIYPVSLFSTMKWNRRMKIIRV